VLDSPALDVGATVDYRAATRGVLGLPVPPSVVSVAKWLAAKRFDVDWDDLSYTDGAWVRAPALVFHGLDDTLVPPSTTEKLAANAGSVRPVLVPGAGHVLSRATDPATYDRELDGFLDALT
jgi:pimeloyl-ACP methyl ester carboxylesterase